MTATGVLRQASWICTDNADKFMQRVNRASFSSCYSRSQELSCWNQYKFLYCSGNWWKVASLECCQLQDAWEEQEEQDALMDCLVKRCLLLCWSRGEVLQMLHFCNGVPIAWHFWIIRLCVCVCALSFCRKVLDPRVYSLQLSGKALLMGECTEVFNHFKAWPNKHITKSSIMAYVQVVKDGKEYDNRPTSLAKLTDE